MADSRVCGFENSPPWGPDELWLKQIMRYSWEKQRKAKKNPAFFGPSGDLCYGLANSPLILHPGKTSDLSRKINCLKKKVLLKILSTKSIINRGSPVSISTQ